MATKIQATSRSKQTKITERDLAATEVPGDVAQLVVRDTEVTGFFAVVGRRRTTFVAEARVNGRRTRTSIGVSGQVREDGRPWTVARARQRAKELLGSMASGVDPHAERRGLAGGPTLREALEHHLERMERGENRRRKPCSPRSIATTRIAVEKHLADHLDEPLVDLDADAIEEVMREIEASTPRRAGSNPANPPGRAEANRVISNVSKIWRSWHKRHPLPVACPTDRLTQAALAPRDTRVGNDDLGAWHKRVLAMENPVRRDLQLVAMFSGVRTDGLRQLRWDDLDWDEELVHVVHAKGDRPYAVPMTETLRSILEGRRDGNRSVMEAWGGDSGWVFPSVARDGKTVQAVAEVKERRAVRDADGRAVRNDEGDYVRETYLPGIHVARRTYNSVAMEVGCPQEIRERLLNHAGRGVNVRHYGVPQDWSLAREWADKVEAAIWVRIRGDRPTKKRAKLRSV
ncbi:MAG: tyrosine-type recombinase/integrase [Deltaproteobacteria bacterium]|nr:tyrosine-type recombinase/integrase [Deltaproteobacteria bacterium]